MKMNLAYASLALAMVLADASLAYSDLIVDRLSLNNALSTGLRYDNNFDLSTTSNYLVDYTGFDTLTSATNVNGYGTGVVSNAVEFSSPSIDLNLVLLRQTGIDISSGALYHKASFTSSNSTLRISFASGITHSGFDFFEFASANGRVATIDVWTIGATSAESFVVSPNAGSQNSQFFGFQDSNGIDFIDITPEAYASSNFSPIIDNLTFGSVTAVPESSQMALLSFMITVGFVLRSRQQREINRLPSAK